MAAMTTHNFSVGWKVETTKGTRPGGTYTAIAGVKGIGDMNPEPAQLDCTDLSATEYKEYVAGLKDVPNLPLTVNMSSAFKDAWEACVTAYTTGQSAASGPLDMWFEITVPNISNRFYVRGIPNALGFMGAEVDQVWGGDVYITVNHIAGWAAPTSA